MRDVRVDPLACAADGVCAGPAPEVVGLDDEGVAHIVPPDPPAASLGRARHAVWSCPKAAPALKEQP